ncbi:MAG: Glu-tRNA(Gln) amidotransferase subunit GatE [Lentimicrobiaceae bacterium]|jgi:glutamyl-tRNA(Gln) amidotransferase subunit E|nr:Glu-tRNA(Gln) amidotransferase subunit GatE [Lentimicrobiaceae bacterium]MCP4910501.1 Glu-tRNA(Gln) amidotransferase subunit GatE [Bacteroidota bacterium]MBT3455355.1 Glu-tRNA(Gln) amidotransferase subunit GatE [Lentimicrobiaceae bacterium]MBT3818805.1 Glu-tRNA(Gln) amidotransferase subunit GatE [Lentimicrobiaceae bacterium]MBT4062072.1 Glu-tRNA(Gln) amidotransferase subunit GatE [Lentimicrobiaceae bacterium]
MSFNSKSNYEISKKKVGYVPRIDATQETYDALGFMSGLEVHQQLLTSEKLFCHCPAGIFHEHDDYNAELIRHMRPTLSELGEYDGTALMEFKTRKEIVYRINNENACTYEIDDTPPFPINVDALEKALEISLLSKLNIVGEVHITRKQYLDGSIPAGFQRTAILGVEGELELPSKKIRLIQLSIEEDSCREISDVGHVRVYKTDRLGMPLIETVTYPDFKNPDEVKDGCDYIRFLNRSTGNVRTGMGAGRQDVNVSCRGGSRVEIKGVAHTKWIPELTHNEVFRQWALLQIRDMLSANLNNIKGWKVSSVGVKDILSILPELEEKETIIAINLPGFKGALSYFTQPGQMFADEISTRLKVIACIEKPNMAHSEEFESILSEKHWKLVQTRLKASKEDSQIIIWANEDDISTAIETVEERCKLALTGVPNETRKSFEDGTTIFERVLPGADRMYPDTDSAPIPLDDNYLNNLNKNLPTDVIDNYKILKEWGVNEEVYTYIFSKNLFPIITKIVDKIGVNPKYVCAFFGHEVKFAVGHYQGPEQFNFERIFKLFKYLKSKGITFELAEKMLPELIMHPQMDFESILTSMNFKKYSKKEILSKLPLLNEKFSEGKEIISNIKRKNWVMGKLRNIAIGNIELTDLSKEV